jgi:hypothetical protein
MWRLSSSNIRRRLSFHLPLQTLAQSLLPQYLSSLSHASSSSADFNATTPMILSLLSLLAFGIHKSANCEENQSDISENAPGVLRNMRVITRAEVTRHKTVETRIWTTFKNG